MINRNISVKLYYTLLDREGNKAGLAYIPVEDDDTVKIAKVGDKYYHNVGGWRLREADLMEGTNVDGDGGTEQRDHGRDDGDRENGDR